MLTNTVKNLCDLKNNNNNVTNYIDHKRKYSVYFNSFNQRSCLLTFFLRDTLTDALSIVLG